MKKELIQIQYKLLSRLIQSILRPNEVDNLRGNQIKQKKNLNGNLRQI